VSAARAKPLRERLFSAAVLRRTFERAGPAQQAGFTFVYEGVLRDLGVTDDQVRAFLAANAGEVDAAIAGGRGRGAA
jgi:hypothetical protein